MNKLKHTLIIILLLIGQEAVCFGASAWLTFIQPMKAMITFLGAGYTFLSWLLFFHCLSMLYLYNYEMKAIRKA